jgi:hypothetical protein
LGSCIDIIPADGETTGWRIRISRPEGRQAERDNALACNPRLRNAIHYLADAARRCDEKSKAKYLVLKARGCSHARALRTIGDRLLYVACAMLKNHTPV